MSPRDASTEPVPIAVQSQAGSETPVSPRIPGYELVRTDLDAVEERLRHIATGAEEPLPAIMTHLVEGGGKRIRPLVLLLAARAGGLQTDKLIPLACAAELMHSATLLHDDVVDEANTRRGRPVAHALWGNAMAVLAGDYCMARSLTEITHLGELRPVHTLAQTVEEMAEGEVVQLNNRGQLYLSADLYYRVIGRKTASLMSWCARVGGLLPQAADQAMTAYGRAVGVAFQIADDILDYHGDEAITGKGIGNDLREGKPTLPLIEACRLVPSLKERLHQVLATAGGNGVALTEIVSLVRECGAIEAARDQALHAAAEAQHALAPLAESPYRDALHRLAVYSADRVR